MSNALQESHDLTINLLNRKHEEELSKIKVELLDLKAYCEMKYTENERMKRQLRFICDRVDRTQDELADIINLRPNKKKIVL